MLCGASWLVGTCRAKQVLSFVTLRALVKKIVSVISGLVGTHSCLPPSLEQVILYWASLNLPAWPGLLHLCWCTPALCVGAGEPSTLVLEGQAAPGQFYWCPLWPVTGLESTRGPRQQRGWGLCGWVWACSGLSIMPSPLPYGQGVWSQAFSVT